MKVLFFTNAGGSTYNFTVELDDPQSINDSTCAEPYSEGDDQLEVLTMQQQDFQLIRAVSGTVVYAAPSSTRYTH